MKDTLVFSDEKAQAKILSALSEMVGVVRRTLGPKGRNVITKKAELAEVKSTNDGIYILRHFEYEDPVKNAAALLVRDGSEKTNTRAGDGTTTTAILIYEIYKEAMRLIGLGTRPVDMKQELETGLLKALAELNELKVDLSDENIENVATIAANNDPEIGKAIAGIMKEAGRNAQMIVEKSESTAIETKIIKGIYWDHGYYSSKFLEGDMGNRIMWENCYVLLTDERLRYVQDFLPFFEKLEAAKNDDGSKFFTADDSLLIVAGHVEGDALNFFRSNLMARGKALNEGFFNVVVRAPEQGFDQFKNLEDFAIMTGAKVISKENASVALKDADMTFLGRADKVIVDRNSTAIIGGQGDAKLKEERIAALEQELASLQPMEKTIREKLEKRLQRIQAGVGVIMAGGPTEIEVRDRNLRIEDAVLATRSANEEGVVAGGGQTYLNLKNVLDTKIPGEMVLKSAFQSIAEQVIINAGEKPDFIIPQLYDNVGYNAKSGKVTDLIADGVIDAAKVIRESITNAVSVAGLLVMSDSIVLQDFVKNKEQKK